MRVLHTSDWHLGRTLEGRNRQAEQEEFAEELCRLADDQQIDLVLVAGDIFDTFNPSSSAEQLFYDTVDRLAAGGKRAVVVIAGNHDSPERLVAASPLAYRHGIVLLGVPGDEPYINPDLSGARSSLLNGGRGWLELVTPGCDHAAVVAAVPYPSEARLKEALQAGLDDESALQEAYSARLRWLFSGLSSRYRPDTVNLAVSHIFVSGGRTSDSERPIFSLGGANTVFPEDLPAGAQYIALGHLHRPQSVNNCTVPCRYSGSPLAYSFSETGQAKSVMVVDVIPSRPADIREIPLSSGRPLVCWRATEGLAQVYRWLDEGKDPRAWIDLEVSVTGPLSLQEIHELRRTCDRLVDIRAVYPDQQADGCTCASRSGLPIDQLFASFYERRYGASPGEETLRLFLDLLNARDVEHTEGGDEIR